MFTPLWIGAVQALPPGGAGLAGRAEAGQVALFVVSVEWLTSNCKRPTPSVRGGLFTADSSASAEATIGSKEQASVWGIVAVKKSPRTLCLGSVLAPFDGKGEGRRRALVFTGFANDVFGTAITIAEALHPEADGQLEGKGVRS